MADTPVRQTAASTPNPPLKQPIPRRRHAWLTCALVGAGILSLVVGLGALATTGLLWMRLGSPGTGQPPASNPIGVAQANIAVTPTAITIDYRLYRAQGMTIMLPNFFVNGNTTTDLDRILANAKRNGALDDLSAFSSNREILMFFAYDAAGPEKNSGLVSTVLAARDATFAGVTLDTYFQVAQDLARSSCSGCRIEHVERRSINGYEAGRFDVIGQTSQARQVCYVVKSRDNFWTVVFTTGENSFQANEPLVEKSIQTLTLYGAGTPMPTESPDTARPSGETADLSGQENKTRPASTAAATPRPSAPALPKTATPTRVSTRRAIITMTPTSVPTVLPTATPTVTPTRARCDNPNARIISPGMDETISGKTPFIGIATVPEFRYYKVQYMPESFYGTNIWGELYQSNLPMLQPGTLMEWTTSTVEPGVYWLRLIVADRSGNYPDPCEVRVRVAP